MAFIWPRRNTVEIRSTEGYRVEIRSRKGFIFMASLKHRGTPWKYDLQKAVDLQKDVNNTEFVLNLRGDSLTGFLEAVKG